jgi:hypothetical protein
MGRGDPELPESIDEAREILSDKAFFVRRSELPAEPAKRTEYVRRLHVALARTARRCEHSRQVVAGERPPSSEPDLPESLAEAEAELDGRAFFIPAEELPDDADRIGEYIERLHVQLARAGTALRYNQRIVRKRQASEESADSAGTAAAAADGSNGSDDPARESAAESPTEPVETGTEADPPEASGADVKSEHAETDVDETGEATEDEADERDSGESNSDGTVERADETSERADESDGQPDKMSEQPDESGGQSDEMSERPGETRERADERSERTDESEERLSSGEAESDEGTSGDGNRTDKRDDDEQGGFVFGHSERSGDAGEQRADTSGETDGADDEETTAERSRLADDDTDGGLTRRQVLVGGSIGAAVTVAVGGGLATLVFGDDGDGTGADDDGGDADGTADDGTAERTDGDETQNPGSGGDDTSDDGDGGTTGGDDGTGGNGDADDGSNGGPGQDWAFELSDFDVTANPDGEYVELTYTGESERDISGYLLYDGEDGQAHPTEQGSLDPFAFPEGTVLSPGESVHVYTGMGEGGDGEFYWGYEVNIWNQGGDTVILEDASGSVVFEKQYGPQG